MVARISDYLTRRFPRAMSSFFDALIWAAMTCCAVALAAWSPIGQTIGQRVKRRVRLAFTLCIGGLALLVVAFAWPSSGTAAFILAVTGCVAFFVGLYINVALECLKCMRTLSPWGFAKGRPKRCPHCRVNFDEPWP
jgi:hypothetical protein